MTSVKERRAFIAAVTGGLLAAPRAMDAQQADKVWRVGLAVANPAIRDTLVAGLQELGHQEGRNIAIDWRQGSAGETVANLRILLLSWADVRYR